LFDKPRISVITIAKCPILDVERTVHSVVNYLSTIDYEHVLILHESMKSREVRESFRGSRQRLYFVNDSGIYDAMNRGIAMAKGDFLWFLNAGDSATPSSPQLTKIAGCRAHDDDTIISGYTINTDLNDFVIGRWPPLDEVPDLRSANVIPHQGTIIPSKLFASYGLYDSALRIHGDYEFWFRCLDKGVPFLRFDIPAARYRLGGLSSSQAGRSVARREHAQILLRYNIINSVGYTILRGLSNSDTMYHLAINSFLSSAGKVRNPWPTASA
jgi:glycosyltransferase involved in cell wall biosynthesis